jgi:predicted transcriptional regulator
MRMITGATQMQKMAHGQICHVATTLERPDLKVTPIIVENTKAVIMTTVEETMGVTMTTAEETTAVTMTTGIIDNRKS